MKIAVTAQAADLDAPVDPRFGRAVFILIVDGDSLEFEILDNAENVNAFKGAGIQAASTLSQKEAQVLLTGYCGPNAFKMLSAAGIQVFDEVSGTVRDALAAFGRGELTRAMSANAEAHWT